MNLHNSVHHAIEQSLYPKKSLLEMRLAVLARQNEPIEALNFFEEYAQEDHGKSSQSVI